MTTIPEELTGLERSVYTTIHQIRTHKRSRVHPSTRGDFKVKIVPDYVLFIELVKIYEGRVTTNELRATLNSLWSKKYIKTGDTGKGQYVEIVDKDEKQ